jgi:hypothetical protein
MPDARARSDDSALLVVEHLRGLLIATGALDVNDPWLARLEDHLATTIAAVPEPANRRVLASWLRWITLPRCRAERGSSTTHSAPNLRLQVHRIVRLLYVLRRQPPHHGHGPD